MVTGMIYGSNVFILVLVVIFGFFVDPNGEEYKDYTVFYRYDKKDGDLIYYRELSYKLIGESSSRCLFSIVDRKVSPSKIGFEKIKIAVENVYSSSPKANDTCVLDAITYEKRSLVFFGVDFDDFMAIEGEFNNFLSGNYFEEYLLHNIGSALFYPFSIIKLDESNYVISLLVDEIVYDAYISSYGNLKKVLRIEKTPKIN